MPTVGKVLIFLSARKLLADIQKEQYVRAVILACSDRIEQVRFVDNHAVVAHNDFKLIKNRSMFIIQLRTLNGLHAMIFNLTNPFTRNAIELAD